MSYMPKEPLSTRMRPRTIDEVFGQDHVIGPSSALFKMIKNGHLPSMILFGGPGVGKTSLAYAIAGSMNRNFYELNAVDAGKKDIERVLREAQMTEGCILFIDELHRFNKLQQDSLLKGLEQGVISLIGATTQNPYHSVNPAIVSRCTQIKELSPLSTSDVVKLLKVALLDEKRGFGQLDLHIGEPLLTLIAQSTSDARVALNVLESSVLASIEDIDSAIVVSEDVVKELLQNLGFTHDKKGDIFYSLLSCYQKSIRGSDVDASLFYLARLLEGGDLVAILRRLTVIAYEDIGLADVEVCTHVVSAVQAAQHVGLPEARIPLSVATVLLSLSPKSNSSYRGVDRAIQDVKLGRGKELPQHLRDTHYRGAKALGYGMGYKYPHDYEHGLVKQEYLPQDLLSAVYYVAKENGKEKRYAQVLAKLDEFYKKKRN